MTNCNAWAIILSAMRRALGAKKRQPRNSYISRESHSKVKASDSTNFYNQTFNSRAVVFEVYLGKAGNITEAPPVADEARRCWRKTRSIAPAPRAIGDYVLRGLNGLRSKTHEPVLFERSEFTGEYAELPTESCKLCDAARRCRGFGVKPRVCFSFAGVFFQTKRKCRNAGSAYRLIMVGREGRV